MSAVLVSPKEKKTSSTNPSPMEGKEFATLEKTCSKKLLSTLNQSEGPESPTNHKINHHNHDFAHNLNQPIRDGEELETKPARSASALRGLNQSTIFRDSPRSTQRKSKLNAFNGLSAHDYE